MIGEKAGYIYIMINASFPKDLLKIGYTKRDPEIRADELSQNTGLPSEYIVAYDKLVCDCELAERLIHDKLKNSRSTTFRNDRSREFFKIKFKDAVKAIDSICDEIGIVDEEAAEVADEEVMPPKKGVMYPKKSTLEEYLIRTGQTGSPRKPVEGTFAKDFKTYMKIYEDKIFMDFDELTIHGNKYTEEIEVLKNIGFTRYPKIFMDPKLIENAKKLFDDGINEKFPVLAHQKMMRAACKGNIQAIKWILGNGYWINFNSLWHEMGQMGLTSPKMVDQMSLTFEKEKTPGR
jgi:hypothetical protein